MIDEKVIFRYGYLYTDPETWGGEIPPREGDSISVSPGMTLIINDSTEKLKLVIVEGGTLMWSDDKDMTFDAEFLIIRGGHLLVGTEA